MANQFLDLMDQLTPEIKESLRWFRTETEETEDSYGLYFSKPLPKTIHTKVQQILDETTPLSDTSPQIDEESCS